MDDYGLGRSRPSSSTPPIGSPNFNGFLDNVAQSYRSSYMRPTSPSNNQRQTKTIQGNSQNSDEPPLLKRYKVEFAPDEPITHLAAGHSQVVVATKDKKILIIDTKTSEQSVCDIGRYYGSRLSQIKIYRLFLDPTGKLLLISVVQAADNQAYENLLYVKQLQSLQKLKSHLITAVAWNYPKPATAGAAALQSSSSFGNGSNTTGTILLGTAKGLVLQAEFTHSDETKFFPLKAGPGQYVKEIFDVGAEAGAITGIEYHQINNDNLSTEKSFVVLLSTSNRIYRMVGNVSASVDPPALHMIIAQNATNFKSVPGRFANSKLDLYYPLAPSNSLPTRFAWLTEPGVMTSELYDSVAACRSSFESNEDINIIPYSSPEEAYFPLSLSTPLGGGGSMSPQLNTLAGSYYDKPISMVVTNFHVIVLLRHCIRAICILNNLTVYEEYFSLNYGEVQGMSKDPVKNIIWVYFKRTVFRYKISMENKNVWKIFLEQKRFDLAKKYSMGDKANYDRVICEEAQHYFNLREYEKSAELFASSKKPFEDVSLMFMDADCTKALKRYLMMRLEEFESLTTQLTMTLSWLFEIIISSITILETRENEHSDSDKLASELDGLYRELEQLLESKQIVDCLKQHPNLFYSIIQNYANWKIHIRVARLIGDHEQLIRAYMNSRKYDEALEALKVAKRADLFYTHGHLIMKHKPKELVDALIEQPNIDASKLIPILIQENPYYNKCCETIRYLEHCVKNVRTDNKIIHNNLFELYARYRNEETLIDYLEEEITADNAQFQCYLDLQACLRVCTGLKLVKTCVVIYSHMGLYDEAVNLALEFDVSLAKSIAKRVESEDHQKRLWLSIARSVLTDKADIQIAAELLSESKLLKIEDILIFFPDYKTVDSISSALHQSLQSKRNEIISIRDGTYEIIANEIRSEIKTFKVRYSKLKCGQKCEICSHNIMSRSHYLFPCGHLFHYDCIIKEIMSVDPQYQNIEDKLKQLAIDTTATTPATATSQQQKFTSSYTKQQSLSSNSYLSQTKIASSPIVTTATVLTAIDKEKIADDLYEITSNECVYCGDFLASYIDRSAPITLEPGHSDAGDSI